MWEFKVGAFREKSIAEIFPLAHEEHKMNTTGPSGSPDTGPLPAGIPTVSKPGTARPPKRSDLEGRPAERSGAVTWLSRTMATGEG